MRVARLGVALALLLAVPASARPAGQRVVDERAAILAVVTQMEAAWNRGDFRGYMAGFENPGVVFVSGGKIQAGWQGTLDHYVRDYGASAETRGRLHFYDMTVEMLAPDAAMLIGHYHLERPVRAAEGINTRLFRKVGGQWRIAMNHVSAYDVPSAVSASPAPSVPADRPNRPSN